MTAFGVMVKEWRTIRRFSQLALAMEADMSARHLSFLETGRAKPSKAMVLRLSQALEMPRPVTNQALHAAGYAAAFPQMPTDSSDLAPITRAVEMMLERHDPYPGLAVDRHWNIVSANQSGGMFTGLAGVGGTPNLMEVLLSSASTGLIENWEEVAYLSLIRLRSEIIEYGGDAVLEEMAERLTSHDRLKDARIEEMDLDQAVIPTILRLGDMRLSLFSTIAQFGTVQDIRSSEMRIELMYPADAATEGWFAQNQVVG